jgi:sarcosine oxidase, subunit gamma
MSKIAAAATMQSPLHSFGLADQAIPMNRSCGVWANEIPLLGYISLRGNASDTAFKAAAAKVLGTPLPTEPCTLARTADTTVLWLSPDEWMIVVPRSRQTAIARALTQALTGIRSQVTGNSGGFTQIHLTGQNARDVLSHCTVYHLDHLGEGRVVGTTFGKSSVYLFRAGDVYRLLLRRSFADYIWRYLVRAASPYGFGIAKLNEGHTGAAS